MVTVREERLPAGWQAVRLENQDLSVLLLPEKGSDIYELRSRPHDLDVLWKAPWGLRPPSVSTGTAMQSATVWLDHYAGGWQELFPNAGDACRYRGAELGFHGEASVAPWRYEIMTGEDGGPEVRLEKRVSLDPERPVLRLWERVTNESAEAMPFMWGHHLAFGPPFLAEGCTLELPAIGFEADGQQTAVYTWLTPGQRSGWPKAPRADGGTVDLSQVPGPQAHVANFGYALDLQEGWYALTNPRLGLGVGLVWPREVFSCVWIWQEFRGTLDYPWYGSTYVMGVEPQTSYPGRGLQRALEQGTARWLAPGEQLHVELRAVLFADEGRVQRITPDGRVVFTERSEERKAAG